MLYGKNVQQCMRNGQRIRDCLQIEVFALHSFMKVMEDARRKMISEKWNIPKQTVNTILKDFQKKRIHQYGI